MDGEPTGQNTFRTKLMNILCREYGRRNIREYDDGEVRILTDDGVVKAWIYDDNAVLMSTLKDRKGDILAIPKDDIADYLPDLAVAYIIPALYETVDGKSYVPHYNFMIHDCDTDAPDAVTMVVDKLAFMADAASDYWNDTMSGRSRKNDEESEERWDPTTLRIVTISVKQPQIGGHHHDSHLWSRGRKDGY